MNESDFSSYMQQNKVDNMKNCIDNLTLGLCLSESVPYCEYLVFVFGGCPSLAGVLRDGNMSGSRIRRHHGEGVLFTEITQQDTHIHRHKQS